MTDHQLSEQQYTTCGLMQQELQEIWDEVGESETERDLMLVEIENQCLGVYRRKLDEAIKCRAQMQQQIAKIRAEISGICSALSEQSSHVVWKSVGGLKSELEAVVPLLESMKKRKSERKSRLIEALNQLVKISNEIGRPVEDGLYDTVENETDLSFKLLEELRARLLDCHDEKRDRQKQVENLLSILKSLCLVLGLDFKNTIDEINPTLNESNCVKDISNSTLNGLTALAVSFDEVKTKRWDKLQSLATSLIELWNLMDIPMAEQKTFHDLTSNIAASVSEVAESDILSTDFLSKVEEEVSRLEQLRSSKLNELVVKKRSELDDICRQTHMIVEEARVATDATGSETSDPECLLEQIELRIARAKEEALSRKELLEKVEKWLTASQEECWLEEYNKDDKRFHAGRGAHLALKLAEKARTMINKIPAMVELLISKTTAWEVERGVEFLYDGERLLNMLQQYNILRQEREQEKKRRKDQKKLKGQLITEKELLYGTKPSPTSSGKKGTRITASRVETKSKISISRAMLQNRKPNKTFKDEFPSQKSSLRHQQCGCFVPLSSSGNKINQVHGQTDSSPLKQKPSTFVSPKLSSKASIENKTPQDKTITTQTSTPVKAIVVYGDEIKTPTPMPIPLPNTPSTACKSEETMEYSFEEVRAGFVNPEYVWDWTQV